MLRGLLGCLGVAFIVGVFLGPVLLQKNWHVPLDMIPLALRVGLGLLGLALIGLAVMHRLRMGLLGVGVMGVVLMVTVTGFIIPGIQAEGSPRMVFNETLRRLPNPTDPISAFQSWDWRQDEEEFYWDHLYGHSRIVGRGLEDSLAFKELKREVQRSTRLVMMTEDQYNRFISRDPGLNARILLEFYRSKKKIVLISLSWNKQHAEFFDSETP